MRIRRMMPEDLDQVAAIEKLNFGVPWTREGFASSLEREEGLFLAAEENGKILGYIGAVLAPPEGDITNVSVHPEAAGRGIGGALVEELLRQTEKKGVTSLFLEVRKSNEAAIHLYQKRGFQQVGIRKNYYHEPLEDARIMVRQITSDLLY